MPAKNRVRRKKAPVEAIFHEADVPDEWKNFVQLNAEMVLKTPSITEQKAPLSGG